MMRALLPILATLLLAAIPVAVPWVTVLALQPPPRRPPPATPVPGARDRALIIIASGEPSWPDSPPPADATSQASPIAYNTDIIARQLGDELRLRGISVRVEAAERIAGAADLLGHELVVLAWPARRFGVGAGLQRLLDEAWEAAVRDHPRQAAASIWAGITIAARQEWADQGLAFASRALVAGGAAMAADGVFLTSLAGAEVEEAKAAFADAITARITTRP
jgi:hypothetical protein